jgi:hypothetical protein
VGSAGELPFVDEQARVVAAPAAAVWRAVEQVMTGTAGGAGQHSTAGGAGQHSTAGGAGQHSTAGAAARWYGRLVGVRGERAFEVARSEPPRRLVLVGEHRFARYALGFTIDDRGAGASVLRAETRAEFPGVAGRLYRGLVIGSRAHVLVVRRLLARVARRAERAATASA